MGLDELNDDVQEAYAALDEELTVELDRETKTELAMLQAVFDHDGPDELVARAIHQLFRQSVDTADIDFHLRTTYDVSYDEYLAGMTYEEMTGGSNLPSLDENNRYRM